MISSVRWSLLFTGDPRYHVPLLPLFALLAASGFAALVQRRTPAALLQTAPQSQHGD